MEPRDQENSARLSVKNKKEKLHSASAVGVSGRTYSPGMTCRQKKSSDLSPHWLLGQDRGVQTT